MLNARHHHHHLHHHHHHAQQNVRITTPRAFGELKPPACGQNWPPHLWPVPPGPPAVGARSARPRKCRTPMQSPASDESSLLKKLPRKAKSLSDIKGLKGETTKKGSRASAKNAGGGGPTGKRPFLSPVPGSRGTPDPASSSPPCPGAVRKTSSAPCTPVQASADSMIILEQLSKIYETASNAAAIAGGRRKSPGCLELSSLVDIAGRGHTASGRCSDPQTVISDIRLPSPFLPSANSLELRLTIKYCNELRKTLNAKRGGRAALLSKKTPNVTLLIKLAKMFNDYALNAVVFDIIRKLSAKASGSSQLVRRNVPVLLFEYFHLVCETVFEARGEMAMADILKLICGLAKYDPKIPLYSRIRGTCALLTRVAYEWSSAGQNELLQIATNALCIFSQNENNAVAIYRSDFMSIVHRLLKTRKDPQQAELRYSAVHILANASGVPCLQQPIACDFGMPLLLELFTESVDTDFRVAVMKVMKDTVATEAGKADFIKSQVSGVLYRSLESIIAVEPEPNKSELLMNSILGVLKASMSLVELPYLEDMRLSRRQFMVPLADVEAELASGVTSLPSIDDADEGPRFCPEMAAPGRPRKTKSFAPAPAIAVTPLGYPDLVLSHDPAEAAPEPIYERPPDLLRNVMYRQMAYTMNGQASASSLVYDALSKDVAQSYVDDGRTLIFDSSFESGNLQKATKVSDSIYDLIIDTDINTDLGRHNQWFFFSVNGMIPGKSYTFNVINMSKPDGQFNYGMQPVMYSTQRRTWCRAGYDICYYKNHYQKTATETFATLTFTYTADVANDKRYFAYHFPYTYTDLQNYLYELHSFKRIHTIMHHQLLCRTLAGNNCDLLTITDFENSDTPMSERKYVLLTSRVHPGETNASWIMKGVIDFLVGDDECAVKLRRKFVFKIVPMLNPDGVINGSHRCSLAGVDLNRQWREPSRIRTPTIYWTRYLWEAISNTRTVLLSCDFHGHSRRKNIFLFGCDNAGVNADIEKIFPRHLDLIAPCFAYSSCKFAVEKSKRSTARVAVWKELQIPCSYTLESSYCGPDTGPYKGMQFTTAMLQDMGKRFCMGLLPLSLAIEQGPYDLHMTQEASPRPSRNAVIQANADDDDDDG